MPYHYYIGYLNVPAKSLTTLRGYLSYIHILINHFHRRFMRNSNFDTDFRISSLRCLPNLFTKNFSIFQTLNLPPTSTPDSVPFRIIFPFNNFFTFVYKPFYHSIQIKFDPHLTYKFGPNFTFKLDQNFTYKFGPNFTLKMTQV